MITALTAAGAVTAPAAAAVESFLEPADYRRLDRRGRGPHELAHLLELGHHGLALYAELLRELVNPDLRHYAPLPGPSQGPLKPDHQPIRRIVAPGRRQFMPFIALCSSSAHSFSTCFPYRFSVVPSVLRYEASEATSSEPGTRNARENARRRCASSKHARQGCRYAPRPGCRALGSGTIPPPAATTRSMLDFATRALQPTQERRGIFPGAGSSARAVIACQVYPVSLPAARRKVTSGSGVGGGPRRLRGAGRLGSAR